MDLDGDGSIEKEELVIALQKQHPGLALQQADSWASGLLRDYDKDGNGSLSRDEFCSFVNERYDELRRIFDALDHSKTGRITEEDVKHGLVQAGVPHMEADVRRVLNSMDGAMGPRSPGTPSGVSFDAFFHASVLLPVHSAEATLLVTTSGAFPVTAAPPGTTPTMIVAAGFINGAVSRTITAPTDRVRALLATGVYPDARTAIHTIFREQGLRGFWNSNLANVVQVAPENGIAFALNEVLRDRFCADPAKPAMFEKFALGGLAGAVAMSVVYPMYVVQNRQAAAKVGQYGQVVILHIHATCMYILHIHAKVGQYGGMTDLLTCLLTY